MRPRNLTIFALLLLVSLPALAADRVIQNGIDLWTTEGNGHTFIDFKNSPIPAGFFCAKAEAFAGNIVFKGVPVTTAEPGALGRTDTIVQRLDDAAFDRKGVAVTRIQVRALQFESVAPIKTACGLFKAEVRLNGEQPITTMRIVQQNADGGRFFAPIAVNGKLVFTPLGRKSGEVLEMTRNVRFPANQGIEWSARVTPLAVQKAGFVQVDTDSDLVPDTYLPGTSNFAAGWPVRVTRQVLSQENGGQLKRYALPEGCHLVEAEEAIAEGHCPGGTTYYFPAE